MLHLFYCLTTSRLMVLCIDDTLKLYQLVLLTTPYGRKPKRLFDIHTWRTRINFYVSVKYWDRAIETKIILITLINNRRMLCNIFGNLLPSVASFVEISPLRLTRVQRGKNNFIFICEVPYFNKMLNTPLQCILLLWHLLPVASLLFDC